MTEIEERRRRQTIRTLITEAFMLTVIAILVIVCALLAMGYQLNFENGVEHSGLVQINSIPSGAAIAVDGEGVFLPTNQSRTMKSGPHEISLRRDGYTSWQKTITVTEGMMYRLSYPRLYKEERESREMSLTADSFTSATRVFVADDRKTLLFATPGSSVLHYLNLNDGEPRLQAADLTGYLDGNLEITAWFDNNNRLLVKHNHDWIFVNLSRPSSSVNLTKEFGLDFTSVRLETSDKLLALEHNHLREINISAKEISKILLSDVTNFTNFGSLVAYATPDGIFATSIGDTEPRLVQVFETAPASAPLLTLGEYYGDYYIGATYERQFHVYSATSATARFRPNSHTALDFTPDSLTLRGNAELIVASQGAELAVFDAESYSFATFTAEATPVWLTEFDFATIKDGWLTVHDFDNTNPHALTSAVSADYPVVISENDRYLYYFNKNLALSREEIR